MPVTLPDAYARCLQVAAAHYENFPVASRLLPAPMRPHVAAVYAFARAADDFADEGEVGQAQRLAWIEQWRELRQRPPGSMTAVEGVGQVPAVDVRATFMAVHDTIARCQLDPQLFDDLLSAFAQDVTTTRYETWSAVLDYCRRSANPVGRLVLGIAGVRDEAAGRHSDAVCTALQLTNFWQDLGDDWRGRGRLYVPSDLLREAGADLHALDSGAVDVAWTRVFDALGARTSALFDDGRLVCEAVRGRLRVELRATWLGGTTILRKTMEVRRRSLHERPVLTPIDLMRIALGAVLWR
jgi:squalene synthase HpnC